MQSDRVAIWRENAWPARSVVIHDQATTSSDAVSQADRS